MDNIKTRTCTKCNQSFPETTEFFRFSNYKQCFNSFCIPCAKKYHSEKSLIFYHEHKQEYLDAGRIKRKAERLTIKGNFNQYRYRAKSEGYPFILSFEQFSSFWQLSCHYCGDSIDTIGLDRVDSSKGYEIDNVVPCCYPCNRMKMDSSVSEFISRCIKIVVKWFATLGHSIKV
jgi:hypothetical protein